MMDMHFKLMVSVGQQQLTVLKNEVVFKKFMISTAKNGVGQLQGSECTPLGRHRIYQKIGDRAPVNAVFVGRQQQHEVYTEQLAKQQPDRDWILTRILWLDGLEEGYNSGNLTSVEKDENNNFNAPSCDTKSRFIYIHGCPDSHAMQIPSSHGCIKMRNSDVIELFDLIPVDTEVHIFV